MAWQSVFQAQHILHVKQAGRMVLQPHGGAHCAGGKRHAAAGFVGDFHALAIGGKQRGVLAHNVARSDGGKADGFRVARARVPFAPLHRAFFQIAPQGVGNHFAHAQRRAAGRIHLVMMVRFNDFNVVAIV